MIHSHFNAEDWLPGIIFILLFGSTISFMIALCIPGRFSSTETTYQLIKVDGNYVEQNDENYIVHYCKDGVQTVDVLPIDATTIVLNNTSAFIKYVRWQVDWSKVRNYWSFHKECPKDQYYIFIPQCN